MVIAICDDDTLFTEQLSSYLKQFFKRNNLTCPDFLIFDSGESLLANTDKKDIVFLDIEIKKTKFKNYNFYCNILR